MAFRSSQASTSPWSKKQCIFAFWHLPTLSTTFTAPHSPQNTKNTLIGMFFMFLNPLMMNSKNGLFLARFCSLAPSLPSRHVKCAHMGMFDMSGATTTSPHPTPTLLTPKTCPFGRIFGISIHLHNETQQTSPTWGQFIVSHQSSLRTTNTMPKQAQFWFPFHL